MRGDEDMIQTHQTEVPLSNLLELNTNINIAIPLGEDTTLQIHALFSELLEDPEPAILAITETETLQNETNEQPNDNLNLQQSVDAYEALGNGEETLLPSNDAANSPRDHDNIENSIGEANLNNDVQNESSYDSQYNIDKNQSVGLKKTAKSIHQSVSEGLWPSYCNPTYIMPEEIEVKVSLNTGDYFFPVKIVKSEDMKSYLGGYRNKKSGAVYHHASTQTPTDPNKGIRDASNLKTRDTQTTETRTLSLQTIREAGTQMEREDVRISTRRDTVKISRRYITADQVMTEKKVKSVVIQRYWRGYLARQRANGIRSRNIERDERIARQKEEEINRQNKQHEENMRRRLQPKTNADFEILYNELDAWRRAEITKIKVRGMVALSPPSLTL